MYINLTRGNRYARQVLSQQNYDSQSIPYRRGEIMDRNGIVLAKSDMVYNVVMDCKDLNENEDSIEPTIRALTEVFGLEDEKIRSRLEGEKTKNSQYQVLLKKISEEDRKAYDAYVSTDESRQLSDTQKKELSRIRGIWFEECYDREYPYGKMASNVIGFANDLGDGIVGIENYYNSLLTGTNGRIFGYLNSDSEFEKKTIKPEHGKNLVLTLDMNIQEIVERYIQDFDNTYGTDESDHKGARNVGVVVMDPNSGEVLGMACNTRFDLNEPQNMSQFYTNSELKKMDDDEYVTALNEMWSNFCVSEGYEPGSVFKPVTISSALECGAVKDGDEFYCDGGEFVTDTQINCDNKYGHGEETLEYAIVNSCNDALMQVGMRMGISNFINAQRDFNFGIQTGIDLPNENPGVVYSRDTMHEVELA
ncbi:MAG: cell division protein FtsI, partial [Lachnospiraceae bacterium]|nr:cell division protein FtsI [Lachnospiraceae bacterium]